MPQPIDMQSEMARTLAAERIQDAATRAVLLAQQRAQIDAERQRVAREREVEKSHQTDSEGVNRDGRGGRRREASTHRARAKEEAPRQNAAGEDHALDVRI